MKLDFSREGRADDDAARREQGHRCPVRIHVRQGRLVKAKVTGIEGTKEQAVKMIKEKLPIGTEFTFKWKAKDDAATLEDLKDAKEKIELSNR